MNNPQELINHGTLTDKTLIQLVYEAIGRLNRVKKLNLVVQPNNVFTSDSTLFIQIFDKDFWDKTIIPAKQIYPDSISDEQLQETTYFNVWIDKSSLIDLNNYNCKAHFLCKLPAIKDNGMHEASGEHGGEIFPQINKAWNKFNSKEQILLRIAYIIYTAYTDRWKEETTNWIS